MTVPTAPALVTIPDVEIVKTGTWMLGTGEATFTTDDLMNAVAAAACPSVRDPVIKIGHVDPRFDGEPAVGRIKNMAVTSTGQCITGDYAGLPAWLGQVIGTAWPDRSIEGSWGFVCQQGHEHPFVITAVALLGVTPPGVGTLGSLADVGELFGVAAAADPGIGFTLTVKGRPMTKKVAAQAAVSAEDIRRAFYDQDSTTYADWVTEVQVEPLQLIVINESTGALARVPVSISGSEITFGERQAVQIEYTDLAAAAAAGAVFMAKALSEAPDRARQVRAHSWAAVRKYLDVNLPPDDDGDGDVDDHDVDSPEQQGDSANFNQPPATGDAAAAGRKAAAHAAMSGRHTHSHSSMGQQGSDATHTHAHDHSGDATHDHPKDHLYAGATVRAWSGSTAEKNLGTDPTQTQLNQLYALPGDSKSDSKLPHHTVSADGTVGAADDGGCSAAIAAINGGRGGLKGVSEADKKKAYNHLAAHLKADGKTPPDYSGSAAAAKGLDMDFSDDQLAALRTRLGVADDHELTAEDLVAALAAPPGDGEGTPAPVAASKLPPGVVALDGQVYQDMMTRLARADAFVVEQQGRERDTTIKAAIGKGKIPLSREKHWQVQWDKDPVGARDALASMPENMVPISDVGQPGGEQYGVSSEFDHLFPPVEHRTRVER